MKQLTSINKEQVKQIYSGRVGCACGCRGNYSTSPRSISLALKKINGFIMSDKIMFSGEQHKTTEGWYWASLELGNRVTTVYFSA